MLRPLLRSILAALILIQISVGDTLAEAVSFPEPSDLLPGKADTTYADLVRLVAPFAFGGETPSDEVAPRVSHIGGGEDITLGSSSSFRRLAAVSVRSGGMDRVALLLDLEPDYTLGLAILALFDVSDETVLLDAVDVAEDRHTFFADTARLPVGTDDDLLVTLSTHHNAGQSYAIAVPILVLDDRFELVDMVFMLGESNCSYHRSQSFSVRRGPGEPFADTGIDADGGFALSADRRQIVYIRQGQLMLAALDDPAPSQITRLADSLRASAPMLSRDSRFVSFTATRSSAEFEPLPFNGTRIRSIRNVTSDRRLGIVSVHGGQPIWIVTLGPVAIKFIQIIVPIAEQ